MIGTVSDWRQAVSTLLSHDGEEYDSDDVDADVDDDENVNVDDEDNVDVDDDKRPGLFQTEDKQQPHLHSRRTFCLQAKERPLV